jgi:hypothetical protein
MTSVDVEIAGRLPMSKYQRHTGTGELPQRAASCDVRQRATEKTWHLTLPWLWQLHRRGVESWGRWWKIRSTQNRDKQFALRDWNVSTLISYEGRCQRIAFCSDGKTGVHVALEYISRSRKICWLYMNSPGNGYYRSAAGSFSDADLLSRLVN